MRFYELLREYNEQRLIHDFGDKLVKRYGDVRATPEAIIKAIAALDPTPNKELTFWLTMNYANERIARWEDIASRAVPALLKFKALLRKPNLTPPLSVRDMNQIKGLSALEDITEQYEEKEAISNRVQTSAEEQKFYDDGAAELFYNDAQIKVVIPRTVAASQFFGRGTRWCTAAENDNRFAEYNSKGPLYIVIFKRTNEKYQFQWESNQFMNARDEGINPNELAEKYPILWKIFKPVAVKNKSLALHQNPTEAMQLQAVQQDGWSIRYLKNPSETVQLAAVQNYGRAIEYIKNPSEAVQLAAVKKNGWAIRYIKNPSEAVQLAAVQQNWTAIKHIENPSEAVQLAAVQQNWTAIKHIENPSEAVQLAAVQQNGSAIQFIKNPSEAIQLAAVKKDGHAIQYIENPSEAVQLAAVQQDGWAITYIKNPSEAVQLAAVKKNGWAIRYIKNPTDKVKALQKKLRGN